MSRLSYYLIAPIEADTKSSALQLLSNSDNESGLYFLQKLVDGIPVYSEKISLGY
jgi:hypothetical protein